MKANALFIILLYVAATLPAQQPAPNTPVKGAAPLPTHHSSLITHHSTRAVVIGISDYQSPQIPNLKYADRDARAFADWLRSPAGGNVPEENITLLTNEKATNSNIGAAFDGLAEESREGDLAIIYFSGHGDVETKTRNQFGFLLAWDSPPNNYKAGAYPLIFLQDIVSTISDKKVRVVVIADACHAGKLAGSTIGGTQATAQTLAQQFANEVKIMSCQPNELALEGEQWGGGRGAFSFNLLEGLTGLADRNADAAVNLYEIDRFLGDVVPQQTAPHPQFPMVVGDRQFLLARVDAPSLAALKEKQAKNPPGMDKTDGKGFVEGLLSEADSALLQLYRDFEAALENGNLLAGNPSADELFVRLSKEEKLRPLHGLMRRNLAAALQNEPQQALNALLESDPYEVTAWRANPNKYADYPRYLDRALELLGDKHYLYHTLLAKKLYFEAYLYLRNIAGLEADAAQREAARNRGRALLHEAIRLDSMAAYLYHGLASSYMNATPARTDSVEVYCRKAMEYAPEWLLPYLDLAYDYHVALNNYTGGEKWLLQAQEHQPGSYVVLERLAWLRQWQNRTEEALAICDQMIALKPDLAGAYATKGVTHWMRGEYDQASEWMEKTQRMVHDNWLVHMFCASGFRTRNPRKGYALSREYLQSPQVDADVKTSILYSLLTGLHEHRQYDLALPFFGLADSLNGYAFFHVAANVQEAKILIALGRTAEAEQRLRGLFSLDNNDNSFYAQADALLGQIAASAGKTAEAEAYFQKAMTPRGFSALDQVEPMEEACALYGQYLLSQNRLAGAEQRFRQALEWRYQNSYKGWYGLACVYAAKRENDRALDCLEKALGNWYPVPEPILEEPLFKKLRKTKRFKALMAKHFPEHFKNR